ncbi:MAG: hypothetical protein QMD46_12780 [Methanomicrobiales archaeon]|nr:hypothetical protein [Methanomicrobiales archaeon]
MKKEVLTVKNPVKNPVKEKQMSDALTDIKRDEDIYAFIPRLKSWAFCCHDRK